ncbi:MAG: NADH-quinone oxidoreductase subunit NuoG [Pseudomonadota bacterium]
MPKLIINGEPIEVEDGITVLQACEETGVEIPRFCYHERLSIAGNCRMCLVEVVGAPKPVASCAMGVNDLRPGKDGAPPEIRTNSPLVKTAREGVMEFLLINHPLDCPICDQGGECDLQDQAMAYGKGGSRFDENKRAVENKHLGPLIKTIMTRCIHCTRCVRFMTEVAGVEELGLIGRGEDAEITTYLEKGMLSELSANVIDLCPVGALTNRPYAYQARPWELRKTETIDVMDAVGSAIRVDARGREVMRILPRNNDAVNEEWISDKTRHVADGLRTQRLDRPYLRQNGKLVPVSWAQALSVVAEKLGGSAPDRVGVIAGDLAGCEELFALKTLAHSLGIANIDGRQDGAKVHPAQGRANYLFNATFDGLEDADAILLIGCDARRDAPVANARIRKAYRRGGTTIGVIGEQADLTYPYEYLGAGAQSLAELAAGKGAFARTLATAKRPLVIVGADALAREDGAAILQVAARIAMDAMEGSDEGWAVFNVLHRAASRVGALDLGFVPGDGGRDAAHMLSGAQDGSIDVLYLLGADEFDMARCGEAFVIYQGTHGDAGAHRADLILPAAAYTEKSATYVNTEGRVQMTAKAVFPPGDAKEDWAILRALSANLDRVLPFDTIEALRKAMYEAHPHLAALDAIAGTAQGAGDDEGEADELASLRALGDGGASMIDQPFTQGMADFYLTNPIARASAVMAELSAFRKAADLKRTGT